MQRFSSANLIRLIAVALALSATLARAGDLVEYYHAGLDHYFITGDANEIRALDSGVHRGWARTAHTLQVFDSSDARLSGSVPVCRFYGNPARGLDSHFYSATPQECEEVKLRFPDAWLLESGDVFRIHGLGTTSGACPANTKAVYRLYNGRADVNHRYTTDTGIVDAMIARGYVLEGTGSGPRPVVFCSANIAPAQPAADAPVCTLSTSTQFPILGFPLNMTASCTGSPATYGWINCNSYGPTCTATASAAGPIVYGVVATNASGAGAPSTVTMNWQPAATAAPSCTVFANTTTPRLGSTLTLTSACSGPVAKYEWLVCGSPTPEACAAISECGTATTSCSPVGRQEGPIVYALRASNNAGTGANASASVTWLAATPPPPSPVATPTCVLTASSSAPAINSTLTLSASCTNGPTGYQWTNCASTTTTCATTESAAGTRTYYVSARNASGFGPAASVNVTWQQPATAAPVCTLSANPMAPYAGGTTMLTANCTQAPSSYSWVGCAGSTGNTCQASRAQTGQATYSVTAANTLGTSSPASLTLNWQTAPPGGGDLCGSYAKVTRIDLVWGGHKNTNDPGGGLEDDGVLAARIQVPSNATGTSMPGIASVVEFVDGPAPRVMTLSPTACDFRGYQPGVYPAPDPTGANGPIAWGYGINPNTMFELSTMPGNRYPKLIPGQIYYVNLRTIVPSTGQPSCPSAECNVRVTVDPPR